MADIQMPQLGESVTEGTITKWFKQVGEHVAEDEVLFEVSTDKVDSEVPSPVTGYLAEIKVPEGETVDVGTVLAVISDQPSGDGRGADARAEEPPAPAAAPSPPPEPPPAAAPDTGPAAAPAPTPPATAPSLPTPAGGGRLN
jgi:2-oxoglutarate dehydrogenase E2 component (dihydrolipoamide succinyltransferase)